MHQTCGLSLHICTSGCLRTHQELNFLLFSSSVSPFFSSLQLWSLKFFHVFHNVNCQLNMFLHFLVDFLCLKVAKDLNILLLLCRASYQLHLKLYLFGPPSMNQGRYSQDKWISPTCFFHYQWAECEAFLKSWFLKDRLLIHNAVLILQPLYPPKK